MLRHSLKLHLRRQVQFFWLHSPAIHELGRIVCPVAMFHGKLKNPAHNSQRTIVTGRTVCFAILGGPLIAVLLADSGDVRGIQSGPCLFQSRQDFLLIKLRARFVVVVEMFKKELERLGEFAACADNSFECYTSVLNEVRNLMDE